MSSLQNYKIASELTTKRNLSGDSKINKTSSLPSNNSQITTTILADELKKLSLHFVQVESKIQKLESNNTTEQADINKLKKDMVKIQTIVESIQTSYEENPDNKNLKRLLCWLQEDLNNLEQKVITQGQDIVSYFDTRLQLLDIKTNFINTIREALEYLNDLNTIEPYSLSFDDSSPNWLETPNDLENKVFFFQTYNSPTIFINLVISVLFRAVADSSQINFQGANSQVRYFATNIVDISTVIQNVPFATYPTTNWWTVISIDTTRGKWLDNVKFFSFTPYLGQYNNGSETIEYNANCNASITSTLIKANNPKIFSSKNEKIYIFYTFNLFFAKLLHNPKENRYAFVLPNMIDTSTFTLLTRFEKDESVDTIDFANSIQAFTFTNFPYFIGKIEEDTVPPSVLQLELDEYPAISSDYEKNKENIDDFISTAQDYSTKYTPLKILPYFYVSNNDTVVTNAYELIDSNSQTNALFNDFNKNYYNSEIITIRDDDGNLLIDKFYILALNHVLSGYSTTNNIQIYNVKTEKSIQTIPTSSPLPFLSDRFSASTTYLVKQEKGIYNFEVDLTDSIYDDITQIAFFERICYPVAFSTSATELRDELVDPGPRYSSFVYNDQAPEANPSTTCTQAEVEAKNIYTIESNDPDYSLHLNYCKYSTLNFRAYF